MICIAHWQSKILGNKLDTALHSARTAADPAATGQNKKHELGQNFQHF